MGFEAASVSSICGICRWCWQTLNLVLLNAPCSSAGGHRVVGTKGGESGGADLGNQTFMPGWELTHVAQRKRSDPLWVACAETDAEPQKHCCSRGEVGGHCPAGRPPFPSSRKHLLLPPPESLSLCFFVRRF